MFRNFSSVVAGACALAAGFACHAQEFYLGADLSSSMLQSDFDDQVRRAASAAPDTFSSGGTAEMDRRSGGRIFAGVQLTPWLGVEADYLSAGTIATSYSRISIHGAINGPTVVETNQKLDGVGLAAIVRAPAWHGLSVFGRAGFSYTRLRIDGEWCRHPLDLPGSTPPVTCVNADAPDLKQMRPRAGLGVQYELSRALSIETGWERLFGVGKTLEIAGFDPHSNATGKFDVDRFFVGAAYRF